MTSNAALQSARRLYSAAKAGHTGTLDPMATRLASAVFRRSDEVFRRSARNLNKTYEADVFGVTTNTGDADGEVLERSVPAFGLAALETAMQAFRGTIRQIPPMYSALKKDGQPLYRLARQGVEIERDAREVTILELRLLEFSGDRCRLRVTCSKGTYIRTLAEDLGRALACGAHLTALRRVTVGSLSTRAGGYARHPRPFEGRQAEPLAPAAGFASAIAAGSDSRPAGCAALFARQSGCHSPVREREMPRLLRRTVA